MNVTPRMIQAQPASGATQLNAAAAAAAPAVAAESRDFARALNDAGENPGRKGAVNKSSDAPEPGRLLPAAGKHSPPASLPPQAAATREPLPATTPLPVLLALPPASSPPLAAAAPKPDGAPDEPEPALAPAAGGLSATIAAATDDDSTPNADAVSRNLAGTLMVPLAAESPAAAVSSGVPLDSEAFNRTAAPRPGAADSRAAVPAAAGSADDGATASINAPASAGSVDTAQTLMAAALAHATDGLPDAAAPAAGALAAASQAIEAQAANSATPTEGLTQQNSAQPDSSAAGLAAAQLAARPLAAAAAAAAATLAASTAKALSAQAQSAVDGAAGVSQFTSAATAASDTAPPPTLKVAAEVGGTGFGQDLAAQVSLMVDSNLTSAKLQVNPPALGPIEVRIALQDGHAQVWLTSHSALTRDALESSSPNLREMLSSQGFAQVSVDISHRSFHQDRSPQSQSYDSKPVFERNEISSSSQASGSSTRAALGIVDAYA